MLGLTLDATQWVGMTMFGIATAICLVAARNGRGTWRWVAVVQAVCCVEVALGGRYLLHNAVDSVLQARGQYDTRQPVQWVLGTGVLLIALGCTVAITARARLAGAGLVGASIGAVLAVTIFGAEMVSLHAIDMVMYAMLGPIKVIGWLWVGVGAITITSAMRGAIDSGRRR